jgi:L-serine dehydratase
MPRPRKKKSIGEIALAAEAKEVEESADELIARMDDQLTVMQQAIQQGLHESMISRSGLVGGQARLLLRYCEAGHETLSGDGHAGG